MESTFWWLKPGALSGEETTCIPHHITASNCPQCFPSSKLALITLHPASSLAKDPLNSGLQSQPCFSTSVSRSVLVHPVHPNLKIHIFPRIPSPLGLT